MRRHAAPCLVAVLLLGLVLAPALYALDAGCTEVSISAGAKVCTTAVAASSNICINGTASPDSKFQIYWGATSSVNTTSGDQIAGSGTPVASFQMDYDTFSFPNLFPGYFVECAVYNQESGSSTVVMCLHPNVTGSCPSPGN
jgi:hypothetical protein